MNDYANELELATGLAPAAYDDSGYGSAVDLIACDGPAAVFVQVSGVSGGQTATISLQDSADQSTWTTRLTLPTIAANGVYAGQFVRQNRYVRVSYAPSAELTLAAVVAGRRKLI